MAFPLKDLFPIDNSRRWLLYLLLFALSTRLLALWAYQRSDLSACLGMDPSYFFSAAIRICNGEVSEGHGLFVGGALYPYFLALMMKLVGTSYFPLRLIQVMIGVVTTGLIARMGEKLFSRTAGIVAGVGYSLCGPAIYSELGFENEFLVSFLTVVALFLLACVRRSPGVVFTAGVFLGLAALARGNQIFAVGITLLWLLMTVRPWRSAFTSGAMLVMGAALAISPVTIRNYLQFHEFIPISAHGGYVFYLGNNDRASYRYDALSFGDSSTEGEFPAAWNEANRRTGRSLTPNQVSSYWFGEGLRFIMSQPGRFLANGRDKMLAFLNDYELPDNYDFNFIRKAAPVYPPLFVTFGLVLPFAIVGLFGMWKNHAGLLLISPLTSLLTVLVFYYNSRFRLTAMPFLLLLGGVGVVQLLAWVKSGELRRHAAPLIVAIVAAVLAFLPPKMRDDFYFPYLLVGSCVETSAPARAVDLYRQAIALHPREPHAYVSLGRLYFYLGDAVSARRELEKVPESPDALIQLSQIEFSQQRYDAAISCLEKAIRLQPNLLSAYNRLAMLYSMTGRHADAEAVTRKGLAIDPVYFKKFYEIGK